MNPLAEHLAGLRELYTRIRRLVYALQRDAFVLVYEAADEDDRQAADAAIEELDPDALEDWYQEQRHSIWEGWSLRELRQLASDARIRNGRHKSREQLIAELAIGPLEAQKQTRGKDPHGHQEVS